jgi:N-acetylmuramoyl-L-alanine amidase
VNRRVPALLFLLLVIASPVFGSATATIDGKSTVRVAAYDRDGVIYVELGPVVAALGFNSSWNESSQKLLLRTDEHVLVVTPRSRYAIVDGRLRRMVGAPVFLGSRLCVPMAFVTGPLAEHVHKPIVFSEPDLATPPPPPALPHTPLYLKKIVLDSGHGGHDPGAKSPEGHKEKDINLAVAARLARRLTHEMGIEVVMTRSDDRFITLSERARIANTSDADLFLSIHANGAYNDVATGTETYFLSFDASDIQAARLAKAENDSFTMAEEGPFGVGGGDDLKQILWDMVRTETLKESEKLASAVQSKLEMELHMPSRGVKQAPFYVLMGSSIPAILVEVGFMTTSKEAAKLASPPVQEKIADALFSALLHYDTFMATQAGGAMRP